MIDKRFNILYLRYLLLLLLLLFLLLLYLMLMLLMLLVVCYVFILRRMDGVWGVRVGDGRMWSG